MTQKRLEELPQIVLSPNDIQVLTLVVGSYLAHLCSGPLSSHRQAARIRVLQGVYHRLSCIPSNVQETRLALTVGDVEVFEDAIAGFMKFYREKTPKSKERDALLQRFEDFRQELSKMLYPLVD